MTSTERDFPVNERPVPPPETPKAPSRNRRREALAALRQATGWTQQNLAAAVGVYPNTVSRWERGENTPSLWVRDGLAEKLKISVLELDALINWRTLPSAPPPEQPGRRRKKPGLRRKRRVSRRK